MTDPYRVLGVSRNASDDEIKKAYRTLSRKYHPDANINNPNKAQAEEKFKEVQQAYDQIMKEKQQGDAYGGFGYGGGSWGGGNAGSGNAQDAWGWGSWGGYQGGFGGQGAGGAAESLEMQAAANYLRNRHYREAVNALGGVPESQRGGRWYYYSAVAHQGLGNLVTAREHAARAVALEPSNLSYRQFQQHLEYGDNWYESRGEAYERPYAGVMRWCMNLFFLNLFCNLCCCGPRCI